MARIPPPPPSKNTVVASWVFGTSLLLFYMWVFIFAPNELPVFKQKMLAIFSALLGGVFMFFLVGSLRTTFNTNSQWFQFDKFAIQSSGGAAAFVLIFLWWNIPEIAPIKIPPSVIKYTIVTVTPSPQLQQCPNNIPAGNRCFYIYKDEGASVNHGIWYTLYEEAASNSSISAKPACKQCKPGFGGNGDSVRIFADISKNPFWTGFVVAVKRDYFGETPARGLNLSGARRLVFYAKSDQENVYIQVKAAVNHDKPFGDSAELPITSEWEPLNQDWQRFEIPIRGNVDLSRVISPLALFVDRNHNPDQDVITFYIDEIYYEF